MGSIAAFVGAVVARWQAADGDRSSAALAWCALFSAAPLLLVATAAAGLAFGDEAARVAIEGRLADVLGPQGAAAIREFLARALPASGGSLTTVGGIAITLFGASRLFVTLREALDRIFGTTKPPEGAGTFHTIRYAVAAIVSSQLFGALLVLVAGMLLVASLAVGTLIELAATPLGKVVPDAVWGLASRGASVALAALAFWAILRLLPTCPPKGKEAALAASLATGLLVVGQLPLAWWVARQGPTTAYGAASSLVAVLLWVYATGRILLSAAVVARVWVERRESHGKGAGERSPR